MDSGTEYCYRVFAQDAIGNEAGPSNVACGIHSDTQAPLPPIWIAPGFGGDTTQSQSQTTELSRHGPSQAPPCGYIRVVQKSAASMQPQNADATFPSLDYYGYGDIRPSASGTKVFVDRVYVGNTITDAIYDPLSGSLTALPTNGARGHWANNGNAVWMVDPMDSSRLLGFDTDGVALPAVTGFEQVYCVRPSRDGRYLLTYASRFEGNQLIDALWIVNTSNQSVVQVSGLNPGSVFANSVHWSGQQDLFAVTVSDLGMTSLHIYDANAQVVRVIADISSIGSDFANTSNTILYLEEIDNQFHVVAHDLAADTYVTELVLDDPVMNPQWGPGDAWIAVSEGCCDVFIYDRDGNLHADAFVFGSDHFSWASNGLLFGVDNTLFSHAWPPGYFTLSNVALFAGSNCIHRRCCR